MNKENITDGKLIVTGSLKSETQSLQDKFAKFMKIRKDQMKYEEKLRSIEKIDRNNPEQIQKLREKFVETAKKYIGVPYAKIFHKKDDPLANSQIYLDCCALVRQVVFDMKEDLGFTLANWNQGYQFDTLPNKLTLEEMKPGDIIFYSGIYNSKWMKPQKHDIVHVEIYLGGPTKEQSIGSRWNKGTIQIFDSFKFQSKMYHDVKHHFRSVETWLKGVCQSFCEEHEWKDPRVNWIPDKHSIFNEEEAESASKKDDPNQDYSKVFYVEPGNNERLIRELMIKRGFLELHKAYLFSSNFRLKWVPLKQSIDYNKFVEGKHLVNHIPNNYFFNNKVKLNTLLEEINAGIQCSSITFPYQVSSFYPETYNLHVAADLVKFLNVSDKGVWILKQAETLQGKGTYIITDIRELKNLILTLNQKITFSDIAAILSNQEPLQKLDNPAVNINELAPQIKAMLVQRYIEKPLLYCNKKCEMRCYILLACANPFILLYSDGYIKTGQNDYVDPLTKKANKLKQIAPLPKKPNEDTTVLMPSFEEHLISVGVCKEKIADMKLKIKSILLMIYKTAESKLDKKFGFFELYGADFIFDEQCNPFLMKITSNPALYTDSPKLKSIIPPIIDNVITLHRSWILSSLSTILRRKH